MLFILSNLCVLISFKVFFILLFDVGFFYFIVICCLFKLVVFFGGKMDCSKSNIYGFVCFFFCCYGYILEGFVCRVCEMNGIMLLGVWIGIDICCVCKNFFLIYV